MGDRSRTRPGVMHSGWMVRVLLVGAALAWASPAATGDDFPPARPPEWRLPYADLHAVASRGARVWAAGYWGTVLRSADAGQSWEHVATPTRETLYAIGFADDGHGWAVGAHGVVLRSRDGGASWTPQPVTRIDELGDEAPLDTHLFSLSVLSADEAWAVGDLGVVLHVRDGARWELVSIPEEVYVDGEVPDRILNGVEFTEPLHGWIVGEFATTLRTSDGGATWSAERRLADTPPDLYLFSIRALDARRAAVVGLAGTVLVTGDGGALWTPLHTGTSAPLYDIAWWGRGMTVVGDRGVVLDSPDEGGSWRDPPRPRLFNWLSAVTRSDDGRLYAVGEKGVVLRSDDDGASWSQVRGREPRLKGGGAAPSSGGEEAELGRVPGLPSKVDR